MLTVYVDFKSPAAYLALQPTRELAARLGLELSWKPYRAVERDVPALKGHETAGESHRRVRAASQRATHIKYAALQGLTLSYPEQPGETDLALGALASIPSGRDEFVGAAFAAYWIDHSDLNDPDTVEALWLRCGCAKTDFDDAQMRETLARAQSDAEEGGIVGVPAFVIQEQLFVGREHFPWIEEIATASV